MSLDPLSHFKTRQVDGVTIITPAFDIVTDAIPVLRQLVEQVARGPEPRHVVLNLAELQAFRSELIAVFINLQKTIREAGGSMKVSNIRPEVRRLLDLTHVSDLLEIARTEEEAIKSLKNPGSWLSRLFGK